MIHMFVKILPMNPFERTMIMGPGAPDWYSQLQKGAEPEYQLLIHATGIEDSRGGEGGGSG